MQRIVEKSSKRFCIIFDPNSFRTLCKVRLRHDDRSFTASIKRAIAIASYIDDQLEQGAEIFFWSARESGKVHKVIFL